MPKGTLRAGPTPPPRMGLALRLVEVNSLRFRQRQVSCEKLEVQEPSLVTHIPGPGRGPSNVCTGPWVFVKLAKVRYFKS